MKQMKWQSSRSDGLATIFSDPLPSNIDLLLYILLFTLVYIIREEIIDKPSIPKEKSHNYPCKILANL